MFDVGDLPVLTFGNWVLKAEWLSGLWNYMYVFKTFFTFFFQNPKNMTFYVFWVVAHVFPNSGTSLLLRPTRACVVVVGPSHWVEIAPAAGGLRQSPIVIRPAEAEFSQTLRDCQLVVSYDHAGVNKITNNGHSLQVSVDGTNCSACPSPSSPPLYVFEIKTVWPLWAIEEEEKKYSP